jgi:uncharacterized protein (DUF4415 family)
VNKQNSKKHSKTDWDRVDAMNDKDIDYSDSPELGDDFFKKATIVMPHNKVAVTMRLDKDIVDWFKSDGPRYQTRINALLRSYMKAKKKAS